MNRSLGAREIGEHLYALTEAGIVCVLEADTGYLNHETGRQSHINNGRPPDVTHPRKATSDKNPAASAS